ncbi:hypothetical protein BC828DRAFT_249672 [Blastocladiella britannica]|nr:hypothetical protein BC828DRAFT_249672 [Blastocladiella britannica]
MGLPAATAPPPPPAQHRRQPRPTSGTAPPAAAFTAVSPSSAAGSGTSSSAAITDAATVPLLTSTTLRHILSGGDAAAHGTGGPRTTSAGHAYAPIALSDISVAPPPTTSQIALAALLAPSSSESTVGDPRHDSSDVFHGGGGLSKPLLMSSTTTLPKKGGGGDKDLLADPGILNDGSTPSYARSTASIAPSRGLPVPPPPKNKMLRVPGLRWNWRDRAAAAVQRRWPFVWLLPVLLLVATAVVSYEVWQVMSASQLAAIQRGNEFRSSQLADRIIFELRARLMAPGNTVRGFLANQPSFNQSTLESFCSLTNWSPWLRVTLAPHIKDVDRPQWESDNRRTMSFVNSSLAPGSQSTTVSTNQVQLPLHVKDDYWPTTYIYPYTPELIGADLYTPPRTEALDASLQLPLNDSDHGYFTNPYGMIIPPSKSTHTPPAIGFSYFTAQLVQNNTYWTVNTLFNVRIFSSFIISHLPGDVKKK